MKPHSISFADCFPQPESVYGMQNIPSDWTNQLKTLKLLKIWVPLHLGGLGCSLSEGLLLMEQAAAHHGSLGWLVNLASGANFFGANLPEDLGNKIFAPLDAWLAGSDKAAGQLHPQENSWRLSGCWHFCTGAAGANFFTLNAKKPDNTVSTVLVPAKELQMHQKWPYFGLKATSSWTVEAIDIHIPPAHLFEVEKCLNPAWPLVGLGFDAFAKCCMQASWLGMLRCYCRAVRTLNLKHPSVPSLLLKLETSHFTALDNLIWAAEKLHHNPTQALSMQEMDSAHGLQKKILMDLFWCAGMSLTDSENLAHLAWRDLLQCGQHASLKSAP